jgi:hypothetical protein
MYCISASSVFGQENTHSLYRFDVGGKYGIMTEDAAIILAPLHDSLEIGDALGKDAELCHPVKADGKWGCLDYRGTWRIAPQSDDMSPPGAFALMPVKQGGKWGFMTLGGEWKISPRYEAASAFQDDGRAFVGEGRDFFYIGTDGNKTPDQSLGAPLLFPENGLLHCICRKYDDKLRPVFHFPSLEQAMTPPSGVDCYVDRQKQVHQFAGLSSSGPFNNAGVATASTEDKRFGLVDTRGNWIQLPRFAQITALGGKGCFLAGLTQNGPFGIFDALGSVLFEPVLSSVRVYDSGDIHIVVENKHGMLDEEGAEVLPPVFDALGPFSAAGLAVAAKQSEWGIIDRLGIWVLPASVDALRGPDAKDFYQGRKGNRWGYLTAEDTWVIEPVFEAVTPFSVDGAAMVKKNGKWGMIDIKGDFIMEPQFDGAEAFHKKFAKVTFSGSTGYVDGSGLALYQTDVCRNRVLKNRNHYIIWPDLRSMETLCGKYASSIKSMEKF